MNELKNQTDMKNEELNLAELLKDCPKGTKFYCLVEGEVEFRGLNKDGIDIIDAEFNYVPLDHFGRYCGKGECVLFPSKDQRDWNVWKAEQKKKHQYQVGDYIILSKGQLLTYFSKIIDRDFGVFKIVEKNETQFITHRVETDIIETVYIEIDVLEIFPYCKIDKYPIDRFQPFDKVLVRDGSMFKWRISYFEYLDNIKPTFYSIHGAYYQCIPYNAETAHLHRTKDEAPEFYINWKE